MSITIDDITGVILAGGQARRMGGEDKGLIVLGNKPMVEYIIDIFQPQVANLLINANRNQSVYAEYGTQVISDDLSGYCGPLAGMASAMTKIETNYLVTTPCDSPFIPLDLVKRLAIPFINKENEISVAHDGERIQPVFCMLKSSVQHSLNSYLQSGERKIDRWFEQHKTTLVDFSDTPETFENINTQEDIVQAQKKMTQT